MTAEPTRGSLSPAASALPAATTTVGSEYIKVTPIQSYGDVFRSLPGFNISNYGQGAVGYGISLRGYTDGEHGRDVAYFIDGVPLNSVSSLHTPNYADLNLLMPETVRSIEITRGPFNIECGDSNLGGCVNITTKRSEPYASLGASGGSWGTVRGVGTYSSVGGAYEPFMVLEGYRSDGYRDNSFVNRYNAFNKLTMPLADGAIVSVRAQAYGTTFGAPGYARRDDVLAGLVSPRSATNSTDGGHNYLENFVTNYSSGTPDQELSGVMFASHNDTSRYADFCNPPDSHCQRVQHEDRTTVGGRIRKIWTGDIGGVLPTQILTGGFWRTDFLDVIQQSTADRVPEPNGVTNSLGINQTNLAGYAQVQVKPQPWLKVTGGARYDQFFYDVDNKLDPAQSPSISPGVWSPKVGVSATPVTWLELYANYAQGFRSIDAALELVGNPGIKPFKIESKEVGAQFRFDRFTFLADVWTTDSENESVQAAPGLPTSLLGRARRQGFDLEGRYYIIRDRTSSLSLFANYSGVSARLLDAAPSYFVPSVPDYVANVGIDYDVPTWNDQRLAGSLFVTFVGKKHLTQDSSQLTDPYQRVSGRLAYSWPEGWTAWTEGTWYPSSLLSEVAFNFGDVTNVPSNQIFVSPMPRFTLMAGLTYKMTTPTFGPLPTNKLVVK